MSSRDAYFDITTENAIDYIRQDNKRNNQEKEQNIDFVNHLKNNLYVFIGVRDKKYDKRTVIRESKRGHKTSQEQSLEEVCYT